MAKADRKSMSEYMLHSNLGKAMAVTGVIGGNFGAYTFTLPLPCFLNVFLDVLSAVEYLYTNNYTSEFPRIN